ncbi:MAG TPA: Hsp20/alpha crystallin family protein [Thermoanaerobaculaceae bacterium]|nr:Hsp20/alpha crystallin family protein [Thermoanaerobaculaceae bacterium]HRS15386.1 Hsp20/alpha crystallin family protein [Thermoanaerobaculaceae bacterium]
MRRRIPSGLELEHLRRHVAELLDMLATIDGPAEGGWTPPVDILALPDRFVVRVDLPGVGREAIAITLSGDELRVSGCKPAPKQPVPHRRFHAVERGFGPFELEIPLPGPVASGAARARLRHGVLEIELPRLHERRRASYTISIHDEEP